MLHRQISRLSQSIRPICHFSTKKPSSFFEKEQGTQQNPVNQKVIDYLDSPDKQLSFGIFKEEPKIRVGVPKRLDFELNLEKLQKKMVQDWVDMSIVLDVDYSFLVGNKRKFIKDYYNASYYNNQLSSPNVFNTKNPQFFLSIEQTIFDPQIFIETDPDIVKMKQQKSLTEEDKAEQQQKIIDLYESEPNRFGDRLLKQFNVPQQYHRIIEFAIGQEVPIYFCGINSYTLRNFLASYFNLIELKNIFIECLNYSFYKDSSMDNLYKNSIQIIYARHYKTLRKFQNGCIRDAISMIPGKFVFFGKTYTVESLSDEFENVTKVNKSTAQANDSEKVEKHAILEVLLGNLWDQPFTFNKFPYLSQNYLNLSEDDKQALNQLYHTQYVRYKGAAKIFFEKKTRSQTEL